MTLLKRGACFEGTASIGGMKIIHHRPLLKRGKEGKKDYCSESDHKVGRFERKGVFPPIRQDRRGVRYVLKKKSGEGRKIVAHLAGLGGSREKKREYFEERKVAVSGLILNPSRKRKRAG